MDIRGPSSRGTAAFAAVAVLALAALPGCSSDEPAQPAGSPAASTGAPSGTAGLPAPVIVEPGQAEATASVGATIVFNQPDPANTKVSTDRPDIVESPRAATTAAPSSTRARSRWRRGSRS